MNESLRDRQDQPQEPGILVGVRLSGDKDAWPMDAALEELEDLATTAGVFVRARVTQRLNRRDPATLVGSGKVIEIKTLASDVGAEVVLFDRELSPRQQRNLERELDLKVLDRTALILDIFAQHTRSREGMLQVELALMEYRLPRLTRMWTHLARQAGGRAGGGVGVRGPGETQLEIDKREIGRRIAFVREQIKGLKEQRRGSRKQRRSSGLPIVALVGYTNAGKSTLLNRLTGADAYAANQLFATLDPTTRRMSLPGGRVCLLTDTVGFIQNLPTQLVAAFSATLEELEEVDLLLHVIDVTHPDAIRQAETVEGVLASLGLGETPVLAVANKADRLALDDSPEAVALADMGRNNLALLLEVYPGIEPVSARDGAGLEALLTAIEKQMESLLVERHLLLPFAEGGLMARLRSHAVVLEEAFEPAGMRIRVKVPRYLLGELRPYEVESTVADPPADTAREA
ncbi:MAG: GTPase HflX [Anaerolineae bacterium]|nr:GTPase HflX [Anaerolineae bacterium]HRA20917.1 GTPase HflX [Anaerolineae bacterium]